MEPPERRTPDFCAESEAYSLFRRGAGFLEDGHPAQAAMHLSRALELEPGRNSIRETLGRAEFALGRYERAAALFRQVVADVPDCDYAHYALARSLRAHFYSRRRAPFSPLTRKASSRKSSTVRTSPVGPAIRNYGR